ncbi:MAG: HepT-like ribonuclease domain-containing protein [Bacteroidota bacterium]
MVDNDKKLLSDIFSSISLIEEFIKDIKSYNEYLSDIKTQSAVERQLSIIGEAVNKYDKLEGINSLENAEKIVGFRNRLVHAYDSIDSSIVWVIVERYLPKLKKEVVRKLKQ